MTSERELMGRLAAISNETIMSQRIRAVCCDAIDTIERLIAERDAAVLAERERCAKVCETEVGPSWHDVSARTAIRHCAAAIRAGTK